MLFLITIIIIRRLIIIIIIINSVSIYKFILFANITPSKIPLNVIMFIIIYIRAILSINEILYKYVKKKKYLKFGIN